MEDFLAYLLKKIIDKPEFLAISTGRNNETIIFNISADPADYGRIIGKKGKTVNALKSILYLYLYKKDILADKDEKIIIRIDSYKTPNGLSLTE